MAIFYVQANAPSANNGNSWATATSLQTALTNANAGDELWLAQGIYSPGTNPTDTFTLNNAVQIYGGFLGNEATRDERDWQTNQTILEGNATTNTVVTAQSTNDIATLDGVIIQGGNSGDDGGGVYNRNNGRLALKNTIVQNNQAIDDGGGIRNDGSLTITNSSVIGNTSFGNTLTSGGGGLLNTVGATVAIYGSTFSGNTATNGGGIRNDGFIRLINSTLSSNTARESGGGLANTINLNLSAMPPTITHRAVANIENSTIVNNEAQNTSEQFSQGGGGLANFGLVDVITNTIIAKNVGNDDIVDMTVGNALLSFSGTTDSGGGNLIGNGDNVGLTNGNLNDQLGTALLPLDPQLDTLQNNGGFTLTHAPQLDSPAIDAGNIATLSLDTSDLDADGDTSEVVPVDQRGLPFARVVDTSIDIGALEAAALDAGVTITPTAGLVTTETGGTASFTVVLSSQPSDQVTVNFISDDPTEGTVAPRATFNTSNWNQPQTLTIKGVDDPDNDGDVAYIINTSVNSNDGRYGALLPDTLLVINQDDDLMPLTGGPTPPPAPELFAQGERLGIRGVGDVSIELSLNQRTSDQVQEIIIFETDSTGAVNGFTATDSGYVEAVLSQAKVVFSTLEAGDITALMPERTITTQAGNLFQFAVISDGSLDSLRRGTGGNLKLAGVSSPAAVVDLQIATDGSVQVGFDLDQSGDFSQLLIQGMASDQVGPIGAGLQGLTPDSELFDLRDQTGPLTATIDVYREASLDSVVGLFVVENEQGQVRDALGVLLNPGDDGYGQAALSKRLNVNLASTNGETTRYTTQILGGQLLSTFLVVDGTVAELLDSDVANDPPIYFSHTLGNRDGTDHVRLLGDNTFGYEDLPSGGDTDFDDVVIKATFT